MFSRQMRKMCFIGLFFAISVSRFSLAQNLTPEFSGRWFDTAIASGTKYDSCCQAHFEYNHIADKSMLIAALFDLPPNGDCPWVVLDSYADECPADFPTTCEDYSKIVENGVAFANDVTQEWLLPALLSKSLGNDKSMFDDQLLFVLKQLQPCDITEAVKRKIKEYLSSAKSAHMLDALSNMNE